MGLPNGSGKSSVERKSLVGLRGKGERAGLSKKSRLRDLRETQKRGAMAAQFKTKTKTGG